MKSSKDLALVAHSTADKEETKDESQVAMSPPVVFDLPAVIAAAGAANPTIAIAEEAIRASQVDVWAADALVYPSLNAGVDYHLHNGNLQSASGRVFEVDKESSYIGAGSGVIGGGRVAIPGVRLNAHVADAVYEPRVARARLTQTHFESDAQRDAVLLAAATRYFELVGAQARLAALQESEGEIQQVAELTANFARIGQGRAADADRAASELELIRIDIEATRADIGTAQARLAQLLSIDPACPLPVATSLELVEFVPAETTLCDLLHHAEQTHPAIQSRTAAIAVAEARLSQERARPWLPAISAGYSAGSFGGGVAEFGDFRGRTDFDIMAVWSLENMGFGNCATIHQRQIEANQAIAGRTREVDRVHREIGEAYALIHARRQELEAARRRVTAAKQGTTLDLARAKNLEGLPIEVLNSVTTLATTRQEYIRAVTGYNQAQFQLFVAMGQSPIAALNAAK